MSAAYLKTSGDSPKKYSQVFFSLIILEPNVQFHVVSDFSNSRVI
jgi:hypothetical protein